MAFCHLGLDLLLAVHAVEKVENEIAVLVGDPGGGEDWVQYGQVGLWNKAEGIGAADLANRGQR